VSEKAPVKAGMESRMKEPYGKELATHPRSEPCAHHGNMAGEALTRANERHRPLRSAARPAARVLPFSAFLSDSRMIPYTREQPFAATTSVASHRALNESSFSNHPEQWKQFTNTTTSKTPEWPRKTS
jgi:hypothetical protein